jgi:hypothetical protein
MLVARLLASTTDNTVQHEAYRFLREARRVTFQWLGELLENIRRTASKAQVLDYQQRVCEMAAICRSTYDVDMPHLLKLLSAVDDHSILISCSVTLYDNQPLKIENAPLSLQMLLCRDRRLAHKTAPIIHNALRTSPRILDRPVSGYWNGYQPGSSGWAALSFPNSRWVSTTTARKPGQSPQLVHLDLLKGRLLVDGNPFGRLPEKYVTHPTYTRLFGQAGVVMLAPQLSADIV